MKTKIFTVLTLAFFGLSNLNAQVGIGTTSPDASSVLDLTATNKGFLPPRMTTAQRDLINSTGTPAGPAEGLTIYNITNGCLEFWNSSNWISACNGSVATTPSITGLSCGSPTVSGTIKENQSADGITAQIGYSGGNGVNYAAGTAINSTGVTGLTATLQAGTLTNSTGNFTLNLSGTPTSSGPATFAFSFGGTSCNIVVNVATIQPLIASLTSCGTPTISGGTVTEGQSASGITAQIGYTGGNGNSYPTGTAISSTGVTGLTATLQAGTLTNSTGNFTLNLSGTPTGSGDATFAFSFGGQLCSIVVNVTTPTTPTTVEIPMGPNGETKVWLLHNLGADYTLDSHTSVVAGIQGAYIQWGRRGPTGDSRDTWQTAENTINFAAAPTSSDANAGSITGWDQNTAADGAWNSGTETAPVKTANDPCPTGYRVPTNTEWTALNANNTPSRTGTFTVSNTNYGAALHYGDSTTPKKLTLPAAGNRTRLTANGILSNRGNGGTYWSSSVTGANAYHLGFTGSLLNPATNDNRTYGFSLRCIAD